MDYRLHITKEVATARFDGQAWERKNFYFAVTNRELKVFPLGFVCIFPAKLSVKSDFFKIFSDKQNIYEFSIDLLSAALLNPVFNRDPDIEAEIKKRIKAYLPKVYPKKRCALCGQDFDLVYRNSTTCPTCKTMLFPKTQKPCEICGKTFLGDNFSNLCLDCKKEQREKRKTAQREFAYFTSESNRLPLSRAVRENAQVQQVFGAVSPFS